MTGSQASRTAIACSAAIGLAALTWASFAKPLPHLVYNPSNSVPVGWYRVEPLPQQPNQLRVGSTVLVHLPAEAAALAAQRGYLPLHVPLLKRVGAVPPQLVCITGQVLRIDGHTVATALSVDRMGRPLHGWPQCRRLQAGEVFLLSRTNPASFDSRYFGPVRAANVIGIAQPLWLQEQP
jgi:conjugative transfer signal peptidase TraF